MLERGIRLHFFANKSRYADRPPGDIVMVIGVKTAFSARVVG